MNDELPVESSESGLSLRPILFNILSIFFLVLSCLCPAFSVLIFAAPNSALNPLRPGGATPTVVLPTNTLTPIIDFPSTWTPTASLKAAATTTRTPARTSEPTSTLVYNPNPQDTPKPFFPFTVEGGNPTYSASPKGCSWLGVSGAAYDLSHAPLNNLLVRVYGTLSGSTIDMEQVTGSISDGKNGDFEFKLSDNPILSLNTLGIQLLDGNRSSISDKIVFNTYAGCDKNLITVIFVQANP
jgi:hypothetical protein